MSHLVNYLAIFLAIVVIIGGVAMISRRKRLAKPKTVFVTYPPIADSRDFMDNALIRGSNSPGMHWECDGGGALLGPDGITLCCSDVTIQPPVPEGLESLLEFLRNLDRPFDIVVRAQGKLITIPRPTTAKE